jgi:putative oxidoreductase
MERVIRRHWPDPACTARVKPILTPSAVAGLTLVMILAPGFRAMRGEYILMILTMVLGAIVAFIAYARFVWKPIK